MKETTLHTLPFLTILYTAYKLQLPHPRITSLILGITLIYTGMKTFNENTNHHYKRTTLANYLITFGLATLAHVFTPNKTSLILYYTIITIFTYPFAFQWDYNVHRKFSNVNQYPAVVITPHGDYYVFYTALNNTVSISKGPDNHILCIPPEEFFVLKEALDTTPPEEIAGLL